jgi:hypothetical protein
MARMLNVAAQSCLARLDRAGLFCRLVEGRRVRDFRRPSTSLRPRGMLRIRGRKRQRWATPSWLIDGILVRAGHFYFGTPIGTPHEVRFGLSSSLSCSFSSVVKPK